MTSTEHFTDSSYPPVRPSEPPKLNAIIIYMAKHRIARRIKAVRLAAAGGKK